MGSKGRESPDKDWIDWLGAILVPCSLLTVFLAGFHSLIDPDVWFHLRSGAEVAAGHIPRVDTFSFPSAGRPYVDLQWGFQFLLFGIHRAAGEAGLIWFACLLTTFTYFIVYRLARREASAPLAAVLVALGIVVASERLSPRPEILTFFLLAAMQWLLRRHEEGMRRAWLAIPAVLLVWVNVQGLFVLGFVLIGARLLDRPKDRRLWQALGLSLAASLVNPYFLSGALHPLVLFTRINRSLPIYSATVGEFLSPFADRALHPSVALFPFYLGLIALGLVARGLIAPGLGAPGLGAPGLPARGRWPKRSEIVLLAVFIYLSVNARRNLALLPLIATPILAGWFGRLETRDPAGGPWQRLRPVTRRALKAGALLASLAAMLLFDLGLVTERVYQRAESPRTFGTGPAPVAFARGAADYINRNRVPGPIFSSFAAGSYFTWAVPWQKVFIDGRLEVHSAAHYERYLRMLQSAEAWAEAEREFAFHAVVLQQTGGEQNLLGRLLRDTSWAPVDLDDTAIVFLKRNAQNEEWIRRDLLSGARLHQLFPALDPARVEAGLSLPPPSSALRRFFTRERMPWGRVYLGQFFLSIRRLDLALAQFVEGIRAAPGAASPRILAAMTLNQMQRPREALALLESLRRLSPPDQVRAQALAARGDALNALGRPEEAVRAYTEYLRRPLSPQQVPSVLANRALARMRAGDPAGATGDVQESIRLDPRDPLPYWVLGQVEEAQGHSGAAHSAYLRFRQLGGRSDEVDAALERLERK